MSNTSIIDYQCPRTMEVSGGHKEGFEAILTPEALEFLNQLHVRFNVQRKELLKRREERQKEIDKGHMPDFLLSTKSIREGDWSIGSIPDDLQDRRVEITGPVERKMIINALNSGAKVFMADFEDSNTPSWQNVIQGQINLKDAVNGTIEFYNPSKDKTYKLNEEVATLMVRPRGWHLEEKYLCVNEQPMSGSLVDFGLYFFHNYKSLIKKGSAPYFYLPKLESHLEARLWNDVFVFAQDYFGVDRGTIKATVLVETILASFELHEILFELKEHSAGLNCGRWDYIFSFIKKFKNLEGFIMPDRSEINMLVPFMKAYTDAVIKVCHKRKAHAMGGMAAQIPIKENPEANEKALEKVRADKLNEVKNGHDGTWVAHPGLVPVAMDAFNQYMKTPNQIDKQRDDVEIKKEDLLEVPKGDITEAGLRTNINVGILYIESWLRGNGAAALYHLMEDAATAEISRTQVWQWLKSAAKLSDGRIIDLDLYEQIKSEELIKAKKYLEETGMAKNELELATELFDRLVKTDEFTEFLTIPAYELIH